MNDPLLEYYETELRHFRQLSAGFREAHPGIAAQLALRDSGSSDPHVERLIQAFAFLTARVRAKLDDEFPELTEAFFSVLYPHYLAPIPSMAVVQFVVDPGRAQLPHGFTLPAGAKLRRPLEYESNRRIDLRYRTTYPVRLWPIRVENAHVQGPPFREPLRPPDRTAAALRLSLQCPGELNFDTLELESLRFFLHGDRALVAQLYEILFHHVLQVAILPRGGSAQPIYLDPAHCLRQVGFERDEGMLPYPNQAFLGYRLLTEFFSFPMKFWFLDLAGLERLRGAKFGRAVEVVFYLSKTLPAVEQGVRGDTFRLGCAPIVNLFEPPPATITLSQRQHEYHLIPDVNHRKGVEVYSVDDVKSHSGLTGETRTYLPFYSFRHDDPPANEAAFWYATRKPVRLVGKPGWVQGSGTEVNDASVQGLTGSETFLHFVDLQFNPRLPPVETLLVRTTCTNRDLPALLRPIGDELTFELEASAPLTTTTAVRSLTVPTRPSRPPLQRGRYWRLLSHLNLNHLSLTDPVEGREALQELLRLYDFSDEGVEDEQSVLTKQLIEGITAVASRRVVGRTGAPVSSGFARGVEVTIEFNEDKCFGTSVLLFASVLERFLGLYASLNSFTKLVAKKAKKEGAFNTWPPRAGEQRLL